MLRTILYGTGTNYLKILARLLAGVVTFRLLYQALGAADFGLFQLLWMSFGYMLLLDFGFGFSIQRVIARGDGRDDAAWAGERREAIATVFWSNAAMSAVVAIVLACVGGTLLASFGFSDAHSEQRLAAEIFALGMVVAFPFGIYREALRGQNRLHVANLIEVLFIFANLALIWWGCTHGWSLTRLMAVSVFGAAGPILVVAAVAMRDPAMRPDPRWFRFGRLKELSAFSLFAYAITTTNLLIMQADQFVIGWLISVAALKAFVPGLKLAGLYSNLTSQMQDTLGPIAARIDTGGGDERESRLQTLLLTSQRWAVLVGTPALLPLAFDFTAALRLLTGESEPSAEMRASAALLLGATWLGLVSSSCTKRILVMTGHHRALLALSLAEAVTSLGSGASLAWAYHSVAGVAAGKCASSLLILLLVPAYACRALRLPFLRFAGACARGLAGSWPALLVASVWWTASPVQHPVHRFLLGTALVAVSMPLGWWFGGMTALERERVIEFKRRWRR